MRNLLLVSAALLAGLSLSAPAGAQNRGGGQGGAYPPIGANGLPGGSWATVCRNGSMNGQTLSAECKDAVGQYHFTTLSLQNCSGDIGDQNGVLACANGAKGTAGGVVADNGRGGQGQYRGNQYGGDQYRGGDRRDDRRDNNNGANAAAGFIAGAILGGALAGNNGVVAPPPPPPPAYGDPRYGDPRYDWRYQQGGYGYGRRPGEWVPIEQRADWLNRQIDRLQRDGRIDYRDARDYRRQLDRIMDRERYLMRSGRFGARERNELDRSFGDLTEEVRHDAREG